MDPVARPLRSPHMSPPLVSPTDLPDGWFLRHKEYKQGQNLVVIWADKADEAIVWEKLLHEFANMMEERARKSAKSRNLVIKPHRVGVTDGTVRFWVRGVGVKKIFDGDLKRHDEMTITSVDGTVPCTVRYRFCGRTENDTEEEAAPPETEPLDATPPGEEASEEEAVEEEGSEEEAAGEEVAEEGATEGEAAEAEEVDGEEVDGEQAGEKKEFNADLVARVERQMEKLTNAYHVEIAPLIETHHRHKRIADEIRAAKRATKAQRTHVGRGRIID